MNCRSRHRHADFAGCLASRLRSAGTSSNRSVEAPEPRHALGLASRWQSPRHFGNGARGTGRGACHYYDLSELPAEIVGDAVYHEDPSGLLRASQRFEPGKKHSCLVRKTKNPTTFKSGHSPVPRRTHLFLAEG